MKLGRGSGRRTLLTPSSSGIARRAETRLSSMAEAYAAKTETALAIDGVPIFIWNKYPGSRPCACRPDSDIFAAQEKKLTADTDGRPLAIRSRRNSENARSSKFVLVNARPNARNSSDYDADHFDSTPRERILQEDYDNAVRTGFDYPSAKLKTSTPSNPSLLDNLDAMGAADDLLSDKIIACPICLGSGFVDSWRPFNGTRIVMDLTGFYPTKLDVTLEETIIPKFVMSGSQQYIEWQVQFPITWTFLARACLFDEENIVPRNKYIMQVILPNNTTHTYTKDFLRSLRGSDVLTTGPVKFRLSAVGDAELSATHFEIIFMNSKLTKAQLPEVEVPYEEEFTDWNLNIGIEVSGKAKLREGSYINDGKYERVWKVDSHSQKRLTSGVVLGQTAQCRALQSFEKMFTIFNVFKR